MVEFKPFIFVRMQNALTGFAADFSAREDNQPFKVVMVYEDFETGKHAKRTYDFLAANVGGEAEFTSEMWKFDVLALGKLRNIAVQDAFDADIVLVSSRGGELPSHIVDWLDAWLGKSDRTLALVSLCDADYPNCRMVHEFLRHKAQAAGLEFFAQPAVSDIPESEYALHQVNSRTADPHLLSRVAPAGQRERGAVGIPRWGLNE